MKSKTIILINLFITLFFTIVISLILSKSNKELDVWKIAINGNSVSSINSYISNYPKGIFSKSANLKLDELTWKETLETNSTESYERYRKLFPKGEFINKADSFLKNDSEIKSNIFDKIIGSKIYFKNGSHFDTQAHDIKFISELSDNQKGVYYIYSGTDDEYGQPHVYVRSKNNNSVKSYCYPGKIEDAVQPSTTKARMFCGRILKNTIGLIWFAICYQNDVEISRSCFIVKLVDGEQKYSDEQYLDARLQETLSLEKRGLCKEIQGKEWGLIP